MGLKSVAVSARGCELEPAVCALTTASNRRPYCAATASAPATGSSEEPEKAQWHAFAHCFFRQNYKTKAQDNWKKGGGRAVGIEDYN